MTSRVRQLLNLGAWLVLLLPVLAHAAPVTRLYVGFPHASQPQVTSAALADALSAALGRKFTQSVMAGDGQQVALRAVQEEGAGERRLFFAGQTVSLNLSGLKPVAMVGAVQQPALTFAVYGNRSMPDDEVLELRRAIDDIVKSRRLPFINYAFRPDPLPGQALPNLIQAPKRTEVSGDYEGAQRFPVLPIKLVPNEASVPLLEQGSYQPASILELARASAGQDYTQIECDYGPFPDGTANWSIRFWKGRKPAIAPEVIDKLQRRNPLTAPTMIDVVIDRCPKTWGLAVAIGNRQATPDDIEAQYRAAAERTTASGLRFQNQLMFSALGADTSNQLIEGKTPRLTQLQKYDRNEQGYTARLGGFDGYSGAPTAEVAAELDQLMKQGYSLLSCAYGFERERDQELIIRDGSNFWLKKRPPTVSKALAQWIDETQFPLVDVALNKCPKYLAQAVAAAHGSGAEADKARKRADEAVRARMSYCDRLQAADSRAQPGSGAALREPSAGDICQALEASLAASYAEWDGLADRVRREVPGEAGRVQGGLLGLRTALMGTAHPVVDALQKKSCRKDPNKASYTCTFTAGFTVHFKGGSLDRVSNVPRQLQMPMGESSRQLTWGEEGWTFLPYGSAGRDTAYDSYVERNLKSLQLDYVPSAPNPKRKP